MTSSIARGFSTASKAAIKWGGTVTLEDIVKQNTGNGEKLRDAVVSMAETLEKGVSHRRVTLTSSLS